MSKDDDRLDWLREIRKEISEESNNDSILMGKYFRDIQSQYEDRVLEGFPILNTDESLSKRKSA